MILVDSSAWIEFYRPTGDPAVAEAVAELVASDRAAVNGIIQVEIVSFAPDRKTFLELLDDFRALHWIALGREDFDLACEQGSLLRGKGITVPATDLIIAASAIRNSASLFHTDSHYDLIADHTPLLATNLSKRMGN
ncbi:MAG: PIN domain-containing protein [Deltaproteobacteria bacterium]|nr:PIN domain-containing protein [Deltaproteobacteria bacterium]